ncbi:unnamed protein product [Lactuca saligna]|uniref:HMG box domain-containing protein n=1 Tax=Lactuca saligna TaxID=75948 RepID=A0AA36E4V1_LACSI|nr:unnamed protein product [Lactuca saligna]
MKKKRAALIAESKSMVEIAKICEEEWKNMTDKQKAGYKKVAKKKNKQYTQEMDVYKQIKEEEVGNAKKEEDELLKVLKQETLQLLKKKEKTETVIKLLNPLPHNSLTLVDRIKSRGAGCKRTKGQFRKISVPKHRYTPLKKAWMDIYSPVYEQMKVDIRMNVKTRNVELMTRRDTPDVSNLQKCADFVHAFMLGFDVIDAVALLRMDELYVDSFEIKDVKTLKGEHLSRAIGRLSGKGGKTKFAIENSTKTRIVIADTKIHILGSFANIKVARDSLCSLILGSPAGKVYSKLRAVTARLAERF